MFLDDELLEMCKNTDCSETDNIQQLNIDLFKKCENYYKEQLYPNMRKKELKVVLDKTFNFWDSFTKMAVKESGIIKVLGELFQLHTFKKQFLANNEIAKIYNSL